MLDLQKLIKLAVLSFAAFKMKQLGYSIRFYTDKDVPKVPRLLGTEEDVVPRFTLGLQSRPRRHLVPLPWQADQYTSKDISNSFSYSCITFDFYLAFKHLD